MGAIIIDLATQQRQRMQATPSGAVQAEKDWQRITAKVRRVALLAPSAVVGLIPEVEEFLDFFLNGEKGGA